MDQVGTVVQVWRYPVKSFQGELVDALDLAPGGAVGDRTLAVVDPAAGKVLSAKRYADLFMASARLDGDRVVITLPDGAEHAADDPGVHDALSAWLDHEVRLAAPPADGVFPMEMYSGMSDEDSPVFDWPGPPGTWLDLADAHWLTTASLAAIAGAHPDGQWDVRRFRPTALIETAAGGFAEEAWTSIQAGTVGTAVLMATPRCSMPSRAQPGLDRDKAVGTTIRDENANNLGVYASVTQSGTVRVGDSVHAS
ncbi:MAG: MOSC N-terminal beta barrel domain-containing protein [Acidimicrobiales bacterium]